MLAENDFYVDGGGSNYPPNDNFLPANVIYLVAAHEYNHTVVVKAFRKRQDADAFVIYYNRNSFGKGFIQTVELE